VEAAVVLGTEESIPYCKRKARHFLNVYRHEAAQTDCGAQMLKTVNLRAAEAAMKHNYYMERLKERDPENFPKSWTPL
jgi:hypothetical protein